MTDRQIDEALEALKIVRHPERPEPEKSRAEEIVRQALERQRDSVKAVPDTWLDPLLTGPNAVIGKPPYYCPDIALLLTAIRKRLAAAPKPDDD